jgi:hypothetical protein
MSPGTDDPDTYQTTGEDPNKVALFNKLNAIPDPLGVVSHEYQGKELYFELFRYLTGQGVYNGHLGYTDFGDNDKNTNLDADFPSLAWDIGIESGADYVSPIQAAGPCARIFAINLMFQITNQEDDSDNAITASKAAGGMGGINLSGNNNSFDTVIQYLKDADLGDGTYGTVSDLEGTQSVTSYFMVDPSKINNSTNGYATAGGTGVALPLSSDPDVLIDTLNNIFKSILSVSTTFVAPSVPVNVFNRTQIVNDVFLALFEADENGYPVWNGNLKKLRIGENAITGDSELQDANGINAIDIDGRVKREAVTFWTDTSSLPSPSDDEVLASLPGYRPNVKGHPRMIKEAARLILASERPVIYAGGGILKSRAAAALRELAELTDCYVVTTLMARGAFPDDHPLCLGMPGMHGNAAAVTSMQRSDLLIALGSRFDDRITGKVDAFAPDAKVIHVDIDPAEQGKVRRPDVPIVGDCDYVITEMIKAIKSMLEGGATQADTSGWKSKVSGWREQFPLTYEQSEPGEALKPQYCIEELHAAAPEKTIVASGVGQHQMYASQFWKFNEPYTWVNSGGLGTMGFSIPAAIGAKAAKPDHSVWAIDGDGCFQMTAQELVTATVENLPIKVALLNNSYLGMVRQWQEMFYDERRAGGEPRPDPVAEDTPNIP